MRTAPITARPPLLGRRAAAIPASRTAELDATMKAMAARGDDVINLGAGETNYPTPDHASCGARAAIDEGFTRYTPVPGIPALREAVGDWLGLSNNTYFDAQEIVISNGAKQALYNALLVLLDPGDEVLVPAPYWVSYPSMIALAGGRAVAVEPEAGAGMKLTVDALRHHAGDRCRVVILNNPTNPTGVVYTRTELEAIAEECLRLGLTILSDEIYDHLVYPPASFHSIAALGDDVRARTVTVGGFSKTFAMTGWRIGFAAAPVPVAAAMSAVQGHTTNSPSSVSQRAALAALQDPDRDRTLARQRAELDRRRRHLVEALSGMPGLRLAAEPRGAFYVLLDVTGLYGTTAADGAPLTNAAGIAAALLAEQRLGVVPAEQFGAPGHIRISYVADRSAVQRALERLGQFCADRLSHTTNSPS